MSDEIKVTVTSYGAGRALSLYWRDPVTGKRKVVSAKTTDPREAERAAAVLQAELNSGRYQAASRITWEQFIERYDLEKLSALAKNTRKAALESLGLLKRLMGPDKLCKVSTSVLSRFTAELRKPRVATRGGEKVTKPSVSDATIARHLRHIQAGLRWAERMGMMVKAPKPEMPKRVKGSSMARARAVTLEEFERMLQKVPLGLVDTGKARRYKTEPPKRIVNHKPTEPDPQHVAEWRRYLRGLWLSGLRLEESLALSWDEGEPFTIDLSGRRPVFRIAGEAQKSGRDELLPMTPDFAQFILETSEAERVGRVFKLDGQRSKRPMTPADVGEAIRRIGRKAGVVTNKADGKTASAHDLRRAFGTRWAKRVMPAVLKRLMRHSSINTTLAYYVDLDTAKVADELWAKFGASDGEKTGTYNKPYNNGPQDDNRPGQAEPAKSFPVKG